MRRTDLTSTLKCLAANFICLLLTDSYKSVVSLFRSISCLPKCLLRPKRWRVRLSIFICYSRALCTGAGGEKPGVCTALTVERCALGLGTLVLSSVLMKSTHYILDFYSPFVHKSGTLKYKNFKALHLRIPIKNFRTYAGKRST